MGIMLLVDNLSEQVNADDLIVRFGDYGIVESATIDPTSSKAPDRRFAYVVMANSEEAQAAIDWLHDTQFAGSTISVARARKDRERKLWLHIDRPDKRPS